MKNTIANIKNHLEAHRIEYGVAGSLVAYTVGTVLFEKTLGKAIENAINKSK